MKRYPELHGGSRFRRLRRQMKRESRLYGSPLRWVLFFATMVAAFAELTQHYFKEQGVGGLVTLAAAVVLVIAPLATFAGRRELRAGLSFVILLAGIGIQAGGDLPWAGTILLVTSIGLIGRAMFGVDASEEPAPPRPDHHEPERN